MTGALPAIDGSSLTGTADATKLPLAGGTMTGDIAFGDNDKATFGASDDLQIYHSGTHSYIKDAGEGVLYLQGSDWIVLEDTDGNNMVACQDGAAVTLYHNGTAKLATTSTGIDVTGGVTTTGARSFFAPASENFAIGVRHATGGGALYFGAESSSSTPDGGIYNSGGSQILGFGNDRNVTIPGGNLVIGTSGKGIDFSATSDAGGMTSEVLDDYEEGTWTCSLRGSATEPDPLITSTASYYTKIGNVVTFQVSFENVATTGYSGDVTFTTLPFTNNGYRAVTAIGLYQMAYFFLLFLCVFEDFNSSQQSLVLC